MRSPDDVTVPLNRSAVLPVSVTPQTFEIPPEQDFLLDFYFEILLLIFLHHFLLLGFSPSSCSAALPV